MMNTKRLAVLGLVLAALLAVLWGLVIDHPTDKGVTPPNVPLPVSPLSGEFFVDSQVTLRWDYLPDLAPRQTFAVQIWYEDEALRENWTNERQFDAQASIDSYEQEIGAFSWQVAVINLAETGGFESMGSAWSPVQTVERVRRIRPMPIPEAQRSAAARLVMTQEYASTSEMITRVRHFINSNSDDETQDTFAADYHDALDMIAAHSNGQGPSPRLLCDGQATAMLTLLGELGIESRLIFLYGDNIDQIYEHTLLEVFNPSTQHWELHDVLSDVSFADENGNPTSIERMVFGVLDTVSVCDKDGECALFPEADYNYKIHFEAFRYGYTDTFWVNPDRFDLTKRFPSNDNKNLAEYLTGNPRDFVFRLDNWAVEP
ncbi:MAG: hypothetical protein HY866_13720 [Chloroflexi bacterium]|nr:hypothetical protein [Chloroflexota bacterium]